MTVDFSTPTSQVSAAGLFTTSQLEIVSKDITSITTLSMYSVCILCLMNVTSVVIVSTTVTPSIISTPDKDNQIAPSGINVYTVQCQLCRSTEL